MLLVIIPGREKKIYTIFKFELEEIAAYHYYKHNMREIYDDHISKVREFNKFEVYLDEAYNTRKSSKSDKIERKNDKIDCYYQLFKPNKYYTSHYKQVWMKKRKFNKQSFEFITTYYKTFKEPKKS